MKFLVRLYEKLYFAHIWGEAFRLLGSLGENEAFVCWPLRTLFPSKGVRRLRVASRYSLSPPGLLRGGLGVWLCRGLAETFDLAVEVDDASA